MVEYNGKCDEPGIYNIVFKDEEGDLITRRDGGYIPSVFAESGRDAFMQVLENFVEYGFAEQQAIKPTSCSVDRVIVDIPKKYEKNLSQLVSGKK